MRDNDNSESSGVLSRATAGRVTFSCGKACNRWCCHVAAKLAWVDTHSVSGRGRATSRCTPRCAVRAACRWRCSCGQAAWTWRRSTGRRRTGRTRRRRRRCSRPRRTRPKSRRAPCASSQSGRHASARRWHNGVKHICHAIPLLVCISPHHQRCAKGLNADPENMLLRWVSRSSGSATGGSKTASWSRRRPAVSACWLPSTSADACPAVPQGGAASTPLHTSEAPTCICCGALIKGRM